MYYILYIRYPIHLPTCPPADAPTCRRAHSPTCTPADVFTCGRAHLPKGSPGNTCAFLSDHRCLRGNFLDETSVRSTLLQLNDAACQLASSIYIDGATLAFLIKPAPAANELSDRTKSCTFMTCWPVLLRPGRSQFHLAIIKNEQPFASYLIIYSCIFYF